jgi:hypothetical protein
MRCASQKRSCLGYDDDDDDDHLFRHPRVFDMQVPNVWRHFMLQCRVLLKGGFKAFNIAGVQLNMVFNFTGVTVLQTL